MSAWLGALALLLAGCGSEPPPETPAGFAGLGSAAGGFVQASPGTPLSFPEDHGPHPDTRLEWWYLTANLADASGESLGVQWTLFRRAQQPPAERREAPGPWAAEQLWMAHVAVSRGKMHRVAERFARGGSSVADPARDQAGVTAWPFRAWLDDWQMISQVHDPTQDALDRLVVTAEAGQEDAPFGYRLTLEAEGPLVRHRQPGARHTAGDTPVYLSQPFYRVSGEVSLDGEPHQVTGRAWLDREWGNQLMAPWHQGWDWFSLHLAGGAKLMVYHLRGDAAAGDALFGSWIAPDGTVTALGADDLRLTPLATQAVAGRELPTRWRLQVPGQALDLIVEASHAERWMPTSVPYWEGAVRVRDRENDRPRGVGYLEMTGY
ncbi:lipocalin-like domain-containing protein [Halomonas cerina]|uniref:Putative secreted hydrolase n=1 Tax=Halomonas cerina TaxID=447424 RepID=A0A839V929_9GAMM|nr:lipocalin-like domain-containing protein [Halomonas cerina]MBB3190405.1 putative secreted hydrolase [Halomonas cerina]